MMKEKRLVRFPNESEFVEMEIDMKQFRLVTISREEIFGWYNDLYISIKHDV
jgi:hypothetical protein